MGAYIDGVFLLVRYLSIFFYNSQPQDNAKAMMAGLDSSFASVLNSFIVGIC